MADGERVAAGGPTGAEERRQSIAVVAVHGIGDHVPAASATSIAELLLRLRHSGAHAGENRYTSFRRVDLSIPVKPAFVAPVAGAPASAAAAGANFAAGAKEKAPKPFWRDQFRERSEYLDTRLDNPSWSPAPTISHLRADGGAAQADSADHQFMRAQLVDYESSGTPYDTLRLEGQRLPPGQPSKPEADVHVYEVHWTDLSRLKWSAIQAGYQLYQLLFHIPHLGRLAVEHAALEFPDSSMWRRYRKVHTAAVRVFTLVIPLVWLTMAATVLTVVPRAIGSTTLRRLLAVAGVAVVALIYGGLLAYKEAKEGHLVRWAVAPLAGAGIAGGVVWFVVDRGLSPEKALSLEWVLLSTALVWWMAGQYNDVRPGAKFVGRLVQVVAAFFLLISLGFLAPSDVDIVDRTLDVFEVEFIAALIVWFTFYGLAALSALLGIACIRAKQRDDSRDRARRAAWTARATLAMSGTAVLLLGLPIWALIYRAFLWAIPQGAVHGSFTHLFGSAPKYTTTYIEDLFRLAAGAGLGWLVAIAVAAGAVVAWTVIPSVLAEVWPPTVGESFAATNPKPGDATRGDDEAKASVRMGRWLTDGYAVMQWAATALFFGLIFAAVLTSVDWLTGGRVLGLSAVWAQRLVLLTGAWLAASAIGLAAFGGRLKNLMLGFRPVLDAILDVDNYLREHPRRNTPRARIAERFASLLRYLCKWRDAGGEQGYSAIVFIAHSQGTVITADFLGFTRREPDPDLPVLLSVPQHIDLGKKADVHAAGPSLYLFTMGSPLRQLYSAAFPHLFSWVRGDTGVWRKPLVAPSEDASLWRVNMAHPPGRGDIDADASPNPLKIGLERWVNAYRSGDYVGRQFWRPENSNELYEPYVVPVLQDGTRGPNPQVLESEDEARTRRELCIGAGAHTHYWDETARSIAVELDRLIGEAIEERPLIVAAR